MPVSPCSRSSTSSASAAVTGPASASARIDGASRFAVADSQGKFVSLIADRMSP